MELKLAKILEIVIAILNINRTFMELKHNDTLEQWQRQADINRTFMELKLASYAVTSSSNDILIEPLWN